jgi:hypothetical protein
MLMQSPLHQTTATGHELIKKLKFEAKKKIRGNCIINKDVLRSDYSDGESWNKLLIGFWLCGTQNNFLFQIKRRLGSVVGLHNHITQFLNISFIIITVKPQVSKQPLRSPTTACSSLLSAGGQRAMATGSFNIFWQHNVPWSERCGHLDPKPQMTYIQGKQLFSSGGHLPMFNSHLWTWYAFQCRKNYRVK